MIIFFYIDFLNQNLILDQKQKVDKHKTLNENSD